jgi:hypothetical protein
MRPSGHHIC